ncbi:LysR family transcriptional regulator [Belnapia sp. T6]|uniref:LysR family transcriptional regulator n=1 Tax=Belnapia mucosa TaxID=2804532 RepID=A0ABS1VAW5_9PROT|nr:LysR family transcriptional regulator [Belnapia mucosa]MBL6458819.1 LysR family transcriptional regulator [Belnapia mucosa]
MNFQQLETLVWLARLRNFHAVAGKLHTTQPSVSARLQRLEEDLGARLVDRGPHGVGLTAAGRECLIYAERILTWQGRMRQCVGGEEHLRGRVSLGVSEVVACTWLPDLLRRLAVRHPEVIIDTHVDLTPQLARGLEEGSFDVVLAGSYRLATVHPTCSLGDTRLGWMLAPGAFAFAELVTPAALQQMPLITWPEQSAIYSQISDWFAAGDAFPVPRHTSNSVVTLARLATAGLGVALLPLQVVQRELAEGKLVLMPTWPDFPNVEYRAIYVERQGTLGAIVAEVAAECSTFTKTTSVV